MEPQKSEDLEHSRHCEDDKDVHVSGDRISPTSDDWIAVFLAGLPENDGNNAVKCNTQGNDIEADDLLAKSKENDNKEEYENLVIVSLLSHLWRSRIVLARG